MKSQEIQGPSLEAMCKRYMEQEYVCFICDTKFSYKEV